MVRVFVFQPTKFSPYWIRFCDLLCQGTISAAAVENCFSMKLSPFYFRYRNISVLGNQVLRKHQARVWMLRGDFLKEAFFNLLFLWNKKKKKRWIKG